MEIGDREVYMCEHENGSEEKEAEDKSCMTSWYGI